MSRVSDMEGNPLQHPKTLYHYCPPQAFFEIIKNGTIRLGRLSAMNDYKEFTWIRSLARRELPDVLKEVREEQENWTQRERERLEAFGLELDSLLTKKTHSDPYCACFSAGGDVLSQWRAYAGGAEGFGIGFSYEGLKFGTSFNPCMVDYEFDSHLTVVRRVIGLYAEYIANGRMFRSIDPETLAAFANNNLTQSAMTAKNPAFREEREYRVLHDAMDFGTALEQGTLDLGMRWAQTQCRKIERDMEDAFVLSGSTMRHFLDIPFDRSSIKRIVLGPKNPAKRDQAVLRMFLTKNELKDVEIRRSKASLR